MTKTWSNARTVSQNREKLYRQLRRQIKTRANAMYTPSNLDKVVNGRPARVSEPAEKQKPSQNLGKSARRSDGLPSRSARDWVHWAEREYVYHHRKVHSRLDKRIAADCDALLGTDSLKGECWKHASHAPTRRKFAVQLSLVVACEARRSERKMVAITLIHDGWRSPIERAVIPLRDIKQRSRDVLKALRFEGVAMIEFDVFTRAKSDPEGHLLAPHVHAVGFIDPVDGLPLAKKLSGARRLKSKAPTIVIKQLRKFSDVRRAVAYAQKPPLVTKREVLKRNGKVTTRTNRQRQVYLYGRLAEILSHFTFRDLLLTCGKKSHWVTEAMRRVSHSQRRGERLFEPRQLNRLWKLYWRERGWRKFDDIRVR